MIGLFELYETMRDAAYSEKKVEQTLLQPKPVEEVRKF